MDGVRRLHDERAKGRGYVSESFGTIAAVGANAALPHYEPSNEHNAVLDGDTVLLIDSGAQYESGTTDITRVTPIHRPDDAIRRDYTAVLRSHLHLLDAYFPEGTKHTHPDGGLFTWAELPGDIDTTELLKETMDKLHISFVAGRGFYVEGGDAGKNCMRISFGAVPPDKIYTGIKRLGDYIKTKL